VTIAEAETAIHRVCCGDLPLEFTHHFWRRAHERLPGFRKHHAVRALRKCRVHRVPVRSTEYGNFTVRVRSVLAGFGPVEIVLAMESPAIGIAFVTIYKSR
jgi:hypothetical protein